MSHKIKVFNAKFDPKKSLIEYWLIQTESENFIKNYLICPEKKVSQTKFVEGSQEFYSCKVSQE